MKESPNKVMDKKPNGYKISELPSIPSLSHGESPLWFPPNDLEVNSPESCLEIHICDSIHTILDVWCNRPANKNKKKNVKITLKKCVYKEMCSF